MGNTIGVGDDSCFSDEPNPIYLTSCSDPDSVCITDMLVDWHSRGDQTVNLIRRCGSERMLIFGSFLLLIHDYILGFLLLNIRWR